MIAAEFSFTIMEYFGIWRPTNWTSKWAIRFYNIYNCFSLVFIYYFALTFLISIWENFDDFDLIMENLFFFSGLMTLSIKMTYMFIYRENIIAFKNMFLQTKCKPRDIHEMAIRNKFHEIERSNSRIFLILCVVTAGIYTLGPLAKGKNATLPFRNWMPYNIESGTVFWITYVYQTLSIYAAIFMFSATEVFPSIMMQQICAQLEIIMYRLLELPKLSKSNHSKIDSYRRESEIIKDCITHHIYMFTIEEKLNDIFGFTVFVQFFATTLNLCTIVYQLSKMSVTSVKFWSVTCILVCYILQIFLYCWYGGEMIAKSLAIADAVYAMNWTLLTEETKKNLILIMVRAKKPIQLNGTSMVTMSVATFLKILNASYSAFNFLRAS